MSTAARKARKRTGEKFTRTPKKPTRRYGDVGGLGLISGAEIMARMLTRSN